MIQEKEVFQRWYKESPLKSHYGIGRFECYDEHEVTSGTV
jgi:hypothetical protein